MYNSSKILYWDCTKCNSRNKLYQASSVYALNASTYPMNLINNQNKNHHAVIRVDNVELKNVTMVITLRI